MEDQIFEGYKVYARPNELNQVIKVFSTCFEESEENDILIKQGNGDEFVHVGYYQVFDDQGCHNYKVVDNEVVETTIGDKELELASRPAPPKSEIEALKEIIASLIMEGH